MPETISRSNKEKINFAKESIAKLRDKILAGATTNRNKLINFKHQDKKRDQIRIVDEVIDEIYDTIGYSQCTSCEILSIHCNECQVCDELFCEDCGPEHSTEETGF